MTYISLPEDRTRQMSFYLAMEEYVARHVEADECFFLWRVEPSVLLGRNRLLADEVNEDFCRTHGIRVFRRRSSGRPMYADPQGVGLSYIVKDTGTDRLFGDYMSRITLLLRRLGIDAAPTGRGQVATGEREVLATAAYRLGGRGIAHGVIQYDPNLVQMVGATTPTDARLLSQGVMDVSQHVALLKDYTSLTIDELMYFTRKQLCADELVLTDADVSVIRQLEQTYLSEPFLSGVPEGSIVKRRQVEGVGLLEAHIAVADGVITAVNLTGDYVLAGDLDGGLLAKLIGVPLLSSAIRRALPDRIDDVVVNLMTEDFVELLVG